ncbi:hypothetical protein MRB53_031400 [Persea americana]|uniref:Uncharacterized protein n=1 Tax=Persea americana TaxID=3435 RepID=A0ACC2KNV2_PERAE|nr:hypothetical protein MRB53_031400 [Persea americana]
MQSLRDLLLWRNNLSAGINSLRGLCELKNLRVLSLASNNLDGRALPPCLSNLSMLEELSLSYNDFGSYSSALTERRTHLPASLSPRRTHVPVFPCITVSTQNAEEPINVANLPLHHRLHNRLPSALNNSPSQPISLHHRLHAERRTHLPVFPCITVSTVANLSLHHRLPASLPTRRTRQNPSPCIIVTLTPLPSSCMDPSPSPSALSGSPLQPISIASHKRSAAAPRNPSPCITVSTQNASCMDPSTSPPISAQQQPLGSPSTTHQGVAKRTQESQLPLLHVAGYERM